MQAPTLTQTHTVQYNSATQRSPVLVPHSLWDETTNVSILASARALPLMCLLLDTCAHEGHPLLCMRSTVITSEHAQ